MIRKIILPIRRMFLKYLKKINIFKNDVLFSDIFSGSIWTLSARIGTTLLSFGISLIVARIYGAKMVGILAIIQAFLSIASVFSLIGIDTAILRLIPEHIANYSFRSAIRVYLKAQIIVIVTSIIVISVFLIKADIVANYLFKKPELTFYFRLASGFIIFKVLVSFNTQAIRGVRLIRSFAIMQAMPHVLMFFLLVVSVYFWENSDAPVYANLCALALSATFGILIMIINSNKRERQKNEVRIMYFREFIEISSPMLLSSLMSLLMTQTGIIFIGIFSTQEEVGYYSIAVKLAGLTTFMLQAINSMAAPKFSYLYHAKKIDDLFNVAHKTAAFIFWTTAPFLVGLIVFGKIILGKIFGYEYVQSYPILVVLVLGQFAHTAAGSTGFFMNMTGRQKHFSYMMTIGAVLNATIGFLTIPHLGAVGAALGTTIGLLFWNILSLLYIKGIHGKQFGYLPVPTLSFSKLKGGNN